jgi:ferredoxin
MTITSPHRPHNASSRALDPGSRLEFRENDCLPSRFPKMSCRRCADACPTQALIATPRGPELAAGCVDCGQCAVPCPTEALSVPGFEPGHELDDVTAVDCWRVPVTDSPRGAFRIPCLGGLSTAALAELTTRATRQPLAVLDRGFCRDCPAGATEDPTGYPAEPLIAELQRLLNAIGIPPANWPRRIALPLPAARMLEGMGEPLLEGRVSRRAFFRGRSVRPADSERTPQPIRTPSRPGRGRQRLLSALERLGKPGTALPGDLFPRLTAGGDCADHRVCASVCPTGALQAYREAGAKGLRFDPAACIACTLCTHLCPEQALTLDRPDDDLTTRAAKRLTRHEVQTCPECRAEHVNAEPLCLACQRDQDFARSAFHTLFGYRPAASGPGGGGRLKDEV